MWIYGVHTLRYAVYMYVLKVIIINLVLNFKFRKETIYILVLFKDANETAIFF